MWRVEAIEPGLQQVTRRSDVDLDSAFASARPRLVRIATSLVGPDTAEDWSRHVPDARRASPSCVTRALEAGSPDLRTGASGNAAGGGSRAASHAARPTTRPPSGRVELTARGAAAAPERGRGPPARYVTLAEVAELVGISHANARQIASRTRARLMQQWREAET
jgi:hypothetical protein